MKRFAFLTPFCLSCVHFASVSFNFDYVIEGFSALDLT